MVSTPISGDRADAVALSESPDRAQPLQRAIKRSPGVSGSAFKKRRFHRVYRVTAP
jgi:hypothetical protein